MAISFVANGALASGTGAITVAMPAGIRWGDFLLLTVEHANQSVATPSGWTPVPNGAVGTGTAGGTSATGLQQFYRFVPSTALSSLSVADAGDHTMGIISAYRGVHQTNPINASVCDGAGSATPSVLFPSVTTTVANCFIVHTLTDERDNAAARFSGGTSALISGITERHDAGTTQGNGGGLVILTGVKATAGFTGNTSGSITSALQARSTIALAPNLDPLT